MDCNIMIYCLYDDEPFFAVNLMNCLLIFLKLSSGHMSNSISKYWKLD